MKKDRITYHVGPPPRFGIPSSNENTYLSFRRVLAAFVILLSVVLSSCHSRLHDVRLAQLDSLQRTNQADTVFRSDSLQRILVDYFDAHGTANDRMLAHYLLGRAYYDMGEMPAALQAYQKAVENADTTSGDVNYHLLSVIHGQMGSVFQKQNLPQYDIDELSLASKYATLDGDTVSAVIYEGLKADEYYMLGLKDSAIAIGERTAHLFDSLGEPVYAAITRGTNAYRLIEKGNMEAGRLGLEAYERQSGRIAADGEATDGESYYYWKGEYYRKCGKPDSALYYFRKLLLRAHSFNSMALSTIGLTRTYEQLGVPDSTAKYALRSLELNDSVYSRKTADMLQQVHGQYNYRRHQQMAEKREHELERSRLLLLVFVLSAAVILLFAIRLVQVYRRRVHLTRMELLSVSEAHERDLSDLKSLKIEISDLQSEQQALMDEKEQLKQVNACILDEMNDLKSEKDNAAEISLRLSRQISVGRNLIARKQREITACKREIEEKTELVELLSNRVKEYENNQPALISGPARASLLETAIYKHILELAHHPRQKVKASDWHELEREMEAQIPSLGPSLKTKFRLNDENYRLCLLVILKLSPGEIATLLGLDHDIVAKKRKRLCKKIFNIEASPGDFDMRLRQIF